MPTQLSLLPTPTARRTRTRRTSEAGHHHLHPSEDRVLEYLGLYYYLCARQVKRLQYAAGSHRRLYEVIRRVAENGYVDRYPYFPAPNAPLMLTLSTKGRQYLLSRGQIVRTRYRPGEVRQQSHQFYYHLEAVNDVLISANQLHEDVPTVTVHDWLHDYDLKQDPVKVALDGKTRPVVFDAWIDFRVRRAGGVGRLCVAVEVDRKTHRQAAFLEKLRRLLAVCGTPYVERFGTTSLTFAVVATEGDAHAALLKDWIELGLTRYKAVDKADLFRITAADPAALSPQAFWCGRHWYRPFDPQAQPLLDG